MITGLIVAIAASITGSFWSGLWFAIRIGGAWHYRGLWDEYRREYDAAYEQAAVEIWACMRLSGAPDAIDWSRPASVLATSILTLASPS